MATITGTITKVIDGGSQSTYLVAWTAMGNADTGTSALVGDTYDRSVQVEGTFGSATVIIQGSNDGTNWQTLTDPQGNALSWTSANRLEQISEFTRYVRPSTSGGTGTSVNVTMYMRGRN